MLRNLLCRICKQILRDPFGNRSDAIYYLQKAKKSLSSAGNWGLLDIFGGNTVSGLFKHMKLGSAESDIEAARRSLRKFSKELRDVNGMDSVEIGGFLTFADFFFDGFIADILVQSKIGKAQRQCDDALRQVRQIRGQLVAL